MLPSALISISACLTPSALREYICTSPSVVTDSFITSLVPITIGCLPESSCLIVKTLSVNIGLASIPAMPVPMAWCVVPWKSTLKPKSLAPLLNVVLNISLIFAILPLITMYLNW